MDKSLGLCITTEKKQTVKIKLMNKKDDAHYRVTDVSMSNNSVSYESDRVNMVVTHSFVNDEVRISFKYEITEGSILKFVFRNEFNDMTIPMEWVFNNGEFKLLSRSDTK